MKDATKYFSKVDEPKKQAFDILMFIDNVESPTGKSADTIAKVYSIGHAISLVRVLKTFFESEEFSYITSKEAE